MTVYIENHKARDPSLIVSRVRDEGQEAVVMTDHSDHYLTRGDGRGCFENYMRILRAAAAHPGPWTIVLQDDVSVPAGLFARMAAILAHAPGGVVAFYVPQNTLYTRARDGGVHVVESYWNFWIQAMAWTPATAATFAAWGDRHVMPGYGGDDWFLTRACSRLAIPVRVVLPSLVQHVGYQHSLLGTSGKVGRYARVSACYDPTFDPATVDWAAAFAAPLRDRSRRMDPEGLWHL